MREQILVNSLRTPDGTVITSRTRHDYVSHEDANGKTYVVDGGRDYLRRSCNGDEEDLSVYLTDDHEENRKHFTWGTYGKDGDQPLKRIVLSDLDTDHIRVILDTQKHITEYVEDLMKAELEYRGA